MEIAELLLTTPGAFRGEFPDIPLPDDINVKELTNGAEEFFVTLPVLKVGAKSQNVSRAASGKLMNRVYGADAAQALVEKINRDRPGGALGHPEAGKRSTQPNAVQWLAARIVGDTVWAKGYVLNHRGDVREDLRVRRAAKSKIATSLYGSIEEIKESGEVIDLKPTNVDIVDPDEAGIGELGASPRITRETKEDKMADETIQEILSLRDKDRDEISGLKTQITEQKQKITELETSSKAISELQTLFGAGKDVVAEVRQLAGEVARLREKVIVSEVQAVVDAEVKLEKLRPIISEMIGAVADADKARARVKELLERADVQAVAKALAVAEQGGSVFLTANNNGQHSVKLDESPQAIATARNVVGI